MNEEVKNRVREMAKEVSLILGDLPDPNVKSYEFKELYSECSSEHCSIKLNESLTLSFHLIRDKAKAGA